MLTKPILSGPVGRSLTPSSASPMAGASQCWNMSLIAAEGADQSATPFWWMPGEGADQSGIPWLFLPVEGADQSMWIFPVPSEGTDQS